MKKKRKTRRSPPRKMGIDLGLLPWVAIDSRPSEYEVKSYVAEARRQSSLDGDAHSRIFTPR
jgi:hypothetical protein